MLERLSNVKEKRKESKTWIQDHLVKEKPTVVTTYSGVKVILPSVRIDSHKQTNIKDKSCSSPSEAKSSKSNKKVGVSKSPMAAKSSKSPIKDKSPMSQMKAKSPKRKEHTGVVDYSRKTKTPDRDNICESPTSNSEFRVQ
ncbi:hypothetical protein L6452_34702 [Arctium lappa]|uniref:Uncharacterized protein n=1 Tax=Arctium lappa TaxID=4217 RepID=A0ACB8YJZ3_ARCLA|nr:hypothetical protein L6452_34702 [Arctium lappa]